LVEVSGKESDDPWGLVWGMVWVRDCYSSCILCSTEKHHRVVVLFSQGKRRMMISAAGQGNRIAVSVEVRRSALSVFRIAVSVVRIAVLVPVLWRIHTMMIDYDLVVVVDLDVVADVVHVVVDAVGVVVYALTVAVEQ